MKRILQAIFELRANEFKPFLLLLFHSFLIGLAQIYVDTTAQILFLTYFEIQSLPYLFIGISIFVTVTGIVYGYFQKRVSFQALLLGNVAVTLLSILAFRFLFYFSASKVLVLLFFVWAKIILTLGLLVFWSIANCLFDIRQAKRLFGPIGSGRIAAMVFGGLTVPFLSSQLGIENMLWVSIGSIGVIFFIVRFTFQQYAPALRSSNMSNRSKEKTKHSGNIWKNTYAVWIATMIACSVIAFNFADFLFFSEVKNHFPDEKKLAWFFGLFYAVVGSINIIFRTFFSGRFLNYFGLTAALLTIPVLAFLAVFPGTILSTFVEWPFILLISILLLKTINDVMGSAVHEPTLHILCQPIPFPIRNRVQAMIESVVKSVTSGFAGITLLVLTNLFLFHTAAIAWIFLGILVLWGCAAVYLRMDYLRVLRTAVVKQTLGGKTEIPQDDETLRILQRSLTSPQPSVVHTVLHHIDELNAEIDAEQFRRLCRHSSEEIRMQALSLIEKRGNQELKDELPPLMDSDPSGKVRGTAIRAFASLMESDEIELVQSYVSNPHQDVVSGSVVGLLKYGGIEGTLIAGNYILQLAQSSDPLQRRQAAALLGSAKIESFYRPLGRLIQDEDLSVRRAAIQSSGQLGSPQLIPVLVDALNHKALIGHVSSALVRFGDPILPYLITILADSHSSYMAQRAAITILQRLGTPAAVESLVHLLETPPQGLKNHLLACLAETRYQANAVEREKIDSYLKNDIQYIMRILSIELQIETGSKSAFLIDALQNELIQSQRRIFYWLSYLYETAMIIRAMDLFFQKETKQAAQTLELLDNVLSKSLRDLVFPVLDQIPNKTRLKQLNRIFPSMSLSFQEQVEVMLRDDECTVSPWTRACLLYWIGQTKQDGYTQSIQIYLHDPHPIIRETALWCYAQFELDDRNKVLQPFLQDEEKSVSRVARVLLER